MSPSFRLFAGLLAVAALLPMSAQADNVFSLQVDPASANPAQLKPGDIFKLDVLLTSDGTTPIQGYQAVIGFDPNVFDPKSAGDASIFTKNPTSPFALPGVNGSVFANGSAGPRVFTGSESGLTTTLFAATPTLLGTFNLRVLASAPVGASEIRFSDLLATPPAKANRLNQLFTTGGVPLKFQNGIVQVAVVPETGTLLGVGLLLGIGGLALGCKRRDPARNRRR